MNAPVRERALQFVGALDVADAVASVEPRLHAPQQVVVQREGSLRDTVDEVEQEAGRCECGRGARRPPASLPPCEHPISSSRGCVDVKLIVFLPQWCWPLGVEDE